MEKYIIDSVDNFPQLKFLCKHVDGTHGIIAGGCFKHIFSGVRVKDFDVFFENEHNFNMAVSYFEHSTDDYETTYENNNAIGYRSVGAPYWFDLIKGRFGTPDQILDMFDFTVTKFALFKAPKVKEENETTQEFLVRSKKKSEGEYKVIYHPKFFEHLTTKKLVIDDQLLFPVSTFNRTYRYRDYGYHLCRESRIKLITELQKVEDVTMAFDMYEAVD